LNRYAPASSRFGPSLAPAIRDSTFGNANGATLVVGATGIYTLQALLTSSGVIHHSWDVIGQICDGTPWRAFCIVSRVALSASVDDLVEFASSRTTHRGTRSPGFIEFGTGFEECFDEQDCDNERS
jgi:hypothetical protein